MAVAVIPRVIALFGSTAVLWPDSLRLRGLPPFHLDLHEDRRLSVDRPELRHKDPNNYLLGRQQRLRLDAELVRDNALAASGLLSKKLGGAPVFPPIPTSVMGLGQVKRAWNASTSRPV